MRGEALFGQPPAQPSRWVISVKVGDTCLIPQESICSPPMSSGDDYAVFCDVEPMLPAADLGL